MNPNPTAVYPIRRLRALNPTTKPATLTTAAGVLPMAEIAAAAVVHVSGEFRYGKEGKTLRIQGRVWEHGKHFVTLTEDAGKFYTLTDADARGAQWTLYPAP